MNDRFRAIVVSKNGDAQRAELTDLVIDDLMYGDVTVAVSHSTVNYKDGLVVTGRAPVVRRFPMIPGIDLAGVVKDSTSDAFRPGDKVLLNGWGLSETHYGGYAEMARVKSDWLVPLPEQFSAAEAMAIGTAGYTAMLSVLALEDAGVSPDKGPILVTGASGGVGSVAVALLSKLGYRVIASTGRPEEEGVSQTTRRDGHHCAQRTLHRSETAFEGTVGGSGGQRRVENSRERDRLDKIRRRRGGLRSGAGDGSADERRAVHFARRIASRD